MSAQSTRVQSNVSNDESSLAVVYAMLIVSCSLFIVGITTVYLGVSFKQALGGWTFVAFVCAASYFDKKTKRSRY
jgi:hypothetical protein